MKTNFFKLSLIAFAAMTLITGCSQDDVVAETPDALHKNGLTVFSTVKDYTPDAATRVAYSETASGGYTTSFEADDEIGIYVIGADNKVFVNNMPMKYVAVNEVSGTYQWKPSNETQSLAFYENATYIAYSPYNKDMTGITSKDDIVKYFAENVLVNDDKTYAECDLMTAESNTSEWDGTAEPQTLSFEFSHALSMVEFVMPTTVTYKSKAGNYTYKGLGVAIDKIQQKAGDDSYADIASDFAKLKVTDCIYRKLFVPNSEVSYTFKGTLTKPNGIPVYFKTQNAFTPAAGTYKKVTVQVDGISAPAEGRDIAVGDYLYADGSIVPGDNDADNIPDKDCIGVVYKVSTEDSKVAVSVMSIPQVFKRTWGSGWENALEWGPKAGGLIFATEDCNDLSAALGKKDGFTLTERLMNEQVDLNNMDNTIRIGRTLIDYRTAFPVNNIGENGTDWCIPAVGDMAEALNALNGEDFTFSDINTEVDITAVVKKLNLNGKTNVDNVYKFPNKQDDATLVERNPGWWTITEKDNSNTWIFVLSKDSGTPKVKCTTWGYKNDGWKRGNDNNPNFVRFICSYEIPVTSSAE